MKFKTYDEAVAYAHKHRMRVVIDNSVARGKRVLDCLTYEGEPRSLAIPAPKKEVKDDEFDGTTRRDRALTPSAARASG